MVLDIHQIFIVIPGIGGATALILKKFKTTNIELMLNYPILFPNKYSNYLYVDAPFAEIQRFVSGAELYTIHTFI